MKFEEMGLSKPLLDSLHAMGFSEPTPIQEQAIPILLKGNDLLGQAQTGTGKTAAFGLPLLEAWLKENHRHPHSQRGASRHVSGGGRGGYAQSVASPTAVILVPTRELAMQVNVSLQKMAGSTGARVVPIYGGIEMRSQLRLFRQRVDILVGTPGRTLDHIRQGTLSLGSVRAVVLDEADRMLDMGFIRDVLQILNEMPQKRQTMLFSATMPREVASIVHKYLKDPKTVKVSEDRLTVEGIRQFYVCTSGEQRTGMLLAAIRTEKPKLSLVFCRMKHEAKKLARVLSANGLKADAMHGNLNQNARERALSRFRNGEIEVMVATDLASRGIDVPGITHVFNYELPDDPMTYVHRIGRTARAGKSGTAISLVGGDPRRATRIIENATGSEISELKLTADPVIKPPAQEPERREHPSRSRHGGRSRGGQGGGSARHSGTRTGGHHSSHRRR